MDKIHLRFKFSKDFINKPKVKIDNEIIPLVTEDNSYTHLDTQKDTKLSITQKMILRTL